MNTCKNCGKELIGLKATAQVCSGACRTNFNRVTKKLAVTKMVEDVTVTVENVTANPVTATGSVTANVTDKLYIGDRFRGFKELDMPTAPHCKDCGFIPTSSFFPNWFKRHMEGGKDAPRSHAHALEQLRTLLNDTETNSKLGLS